MSWNKISRKYQFATIENATGKRDTLHTTKQEAQDRIETLVALGGNYAQPEDWRIEERPAGAVRI